VAVRTLNLYSDTTDLLTGSLNLTKLNPALFVGNASDYVDSRVGMRYVTPFDISGSGPLNNSSKLILKQIANAYASGTLLMAAFSPIEDKQLNAYGQKLVDYAEVQLIKIITGEILLPGAPMINPYPPGFVPSAAVGIFNVDATSYVEDFYTKNQKSCGFGGVVYPHGLFPE